MKRSLLISALAAALSLSTGFAVAADQTPVQEKAKVQKQEFIYGSQLMTKQERLEFRAKIRAAKTPEEREQIRIEHHKLMQQRAKERGVTLAEQPVPHEGRMGPGEAMGPGEGRGR